MPPSSNSPSKPQLPTSPPRVTLPLLHPNQECKWGWSLTKPGVTYIAANDGPRFSEEPEWKRIWMKLTHIQRHDQSQRHVPSSLSRPQWASGLCASSPFSSCWMEMGKSDGEPMATGVIPYTATNRFVMRWDSQLSKWEAVFFNRRTSKIDTRNT